MPTDTAERTEARKPRAFTTVLIDTAYASVGATDAMIAWLRTLEFGTLAARGREVVQRAAKKPPADA